MPKEVFTVSEWAGGMNQNVDPMDSLQTQTLRFAQNVHFDNKGQLTKVDINSFTFGDHEANISGNVSSGFLPNGLVDLERGIGHYLPSNAAALSLVVSAPVDSPSSELSWEDGNYDFKYTVCRVLDNGVTEEGPLKDFLSGGTNINMTADNKGKFTFAHTGDFLDTLGHPVFFNEDYEGKLCGRVYYSRREGQGSATQTGWIHLCDLVLVDFDDANGVMPRAVDTTVIPSATDIDIEEPPTASTFETNAGYPSEVGIKNVDESPFTDCEAKVVLGMITYVAKSGFIYRSLAGQRDVYPADDWIDLTAYGTDSPCVAMYGEGNVLYYFTLNDLVVFDITNDIIIKTLRGMGTPHAKTSCKVGEGVAWQTPVDNGMFDVHFISQEGIKNLSQNKVLYSNGALSGEYIQMAYNDSLKWLMYMSLAANENDESESLISLGYAYVYSFLTDSWFYSVSGFDTEDTSIIDFGYFHAGDPARYKKIYKIVVHGESLDGAVIKVYNSITNTDIEISGTTNVEIDGTMVGNDQASNSYMGGGIAEWIPDASVKERKIKIKIENLPAESLKTKVQSISVVYRMMNKF